MFREHAKILVSTKIVSVGSSMLRTNHMKQDDKLLERHFCVFIKRILRLSLGQTYHQRQHHQSLIPTILYRPFE